MMNLLRCAIVVSDVAVPFLARRDRTESDVKIGNLVRPDGANQPKAKLAYEAFRIRVFVRAANQRALGQNNPTG